MNPETKICQNCYQNFTIEPEDFKFYEKISVPPPTWCPECRMIRRFTFRNEHTLFRRKCDLCGKDIVANFSANGKSRVYCPECWWSDKWDPLSYGKEYDFSKSFFEQFRSIAKITPHLNLWAFNMVNSDYANYCGYVKNIYLSVSVVGGEDIYYSSYLDKSFNIFDSDKVKDSELCYENINGANNSRSHFLVDSRDCIDSLFLYNCVNCQNCFMSSNLRNKKFHIRNEPYSKEEYFKKLEDNNLGSNKSITELKVDFSELHKNALHKFAAVIKSVGVTGDNITASKNSHNVYNAEEVENVNFSWRVHHLKDSYDVAGVIFSELCYEVSTGGDYNYLGKFYTHSKSVNNFEYSHFSPDSSNLFGCYGLRSKSYCILNKQYTKEEYETLVPRIIKHMNDMPYIDKKGRVYKYGEFFPPELSPFSYNETIAQEYFPLTKEEALNQGYSWKDTEPRNYQITLKTEDIPDHIKDVPDSILNDIIQCAHNIGTSDDVQNCNEQCTEAYLIIPQELDFLRKQNLPIPRLCPNCRHYSRIKQRNPLKLWHRKCQCAGSKSENQVYANTIAHEHGENHCENNFETTYAPERQEIVYCESCYLKEVV